MGLEERQICFIGGGAVAEALIRGLLAENALPPNRIFALEVSSSRRHLLEERFGVQVGDPGAAESALAAADVVILAVKPNQLDDAMLAYRRYFQQGQLLVSVLAGVNTALLGRYLPSGVSVIRAMPNTSAAVGRSATAICAATGTSGASLDWSEALFGLVGTVVRVPEATMDAVTALSGSGPAYVYSLAEAMEQGGMAAGLDQATSRELTIQTLLGAAYMLDSQQLEPAELRRRVSSPGGTTMAGLEVLQSAHFAEIIQQAILSAADRSRVLSDQVEAASS